MYLESYLFIIRYLDIVIAILFLDAIYFEKNLSRADVFLSTHLGSLPEKAAQKHAVKYF